MYLAATRAVRLTSGRVDAKELGHQLEPQHEVGKGDAPLRHRQNKGAAL